MVSIWAPATLQRSSITRVSMVMVTGDGDVTATVRSSSRGSVSTLRCKGESSNDEHSKRRGKYKETTIKLAASRKTALAAALVTAANERVNGRSGTAEVEMGVLASIKMMSHCSEW